MLKYFYVMHRFVAREKSPEAQFATFIKGYLQTFPEEQTTVLRIFRFVTGLEYPEAMPPELWLKVDGYKHRILVLDAWGALTVPVYTFNLNAAEAVDLLTVPGMSAEEARRIIAYRDAQGGLPGLETLRETPGLAPATVERLLQCRMQPEASGGTEEPELSIGGFIQAVLKKFILGVALYSFLAGFAVWLLFRRSEPFRWKKALWFFLTYSFYSLFLALTGLFAAMALQRPAEIYAGFLLAAGLVTLLLFFRKPGVMREVLVFTALMGGMILMSLV